jgi:hypothetical protein
VHHDERLGRLVDVDAAFRAVDRDVWSQCCKSYKKLCRVSLLFTIKKPPSSLPVTSRFHTKDFLIGLCTYLLL